MHNSRSKSSGHYAIQAPHSRRKSRFLPHNRFLHQSIIYIRLLKSKRKSTAENCGAFHDYCFVKTTSAISNPSELAVRQASPPLATD